MIHELKYPIPNFIVSRKRLEQKMVGKGGNLGGTVVISYEGDFFESWCVRIGIEITMGVTDGKQCSERGK